MSCQETGASFRALCYIRVQKLLLLLVRTFIGRYLLHADMLEVH
jgi:hypothetical protein